MTPEHCGYWLRGLLNLLSWYVPFTMPFVHTLFNTMIDMCRGMK